jgi:predicted  nucleic acid-binding Zn-ribbon protein
MASLEAVAAIVAAGAEAIALVVTAIGITRGSAKKYGALGQRVKDLEDTMNDHEARVRCLETEKSEAGKNIAVLQAGQQAIDDKITTLTVTFSERMRDMRDQFLQALDNLKSFIRDGKGA